MAWNAVFLLGIALVSSLMSLIFRGDDRLLSFYTENHTILWGNFTVLPLLAAVMVLLLSIIRNRFRLPLHIAISLGVFLYLSPDAQNAGIIILGTVVVYALERFVPRSNIVNALLVFGVIALVLVPTKFSSGGQRDSWFLTLLRIGWNLRLLSWVVERRVQSRTAYGSLWEFLDYLFNPVFFLFPSLLNVVRFSYFQRQREILLNNRDRFRALALSFWGMFLYGLFIVLFRFEIFPNKGALLGDFAWGAPEFFLNHIVAGAIIVVLSVLHHAGIVAIQTSIARFLGYQLRYDSYYPLLSRSPYEYWRRTHNYVREYILEVFYAPIAGALRSFRVPPLFLSITGLGLSYLLFSPFLVGYRPHSLQFSNFAFLFFSIFFLLFIALPISIGRYTRIGALLQRSWVKPLFGVWEPKPVLSWHAGDWILWLFTVALYGARMWGYFFINKVL